MPTYRNGYIPESLLVTFATGWSKTDGDWKHQLSPGTYAKHAALVKRSPGGKLQITQGWGAYRPYSAQVIARRLYGNGAALPGTSSHGGFWESRQTLAIDYHNWGAIYGWDQGRWFADCRAVGLTPGMIMRSRGYPDEPWHVIDLDPWAPAPASIGATPFEEDDLDSTQNFKLDAIFRALVKDANGGQYFMTDHIAGRLANIEPLVADVQGRVRGQDPRGDMLQLIMEKLGLPITVDVDEVSLAKELAPLIPAHVASFSDEDIARISEAVADEQARRQAS
jgi:hypothetical protein